MQVVSPGLYVGSPMKSRRRKGSRFAKQNHVCACYVEVSSHRHDGELCSHVQNLELGYGDFYVSEFACRLG